MMLGSAWAFAGAVLVICIWILTGPTFHFSDTWQLIINTATTVITFLMVFLIQNTQNRDAKAMHLKLDEIIRALKGARNQLVDLEDLSDEELKKTRRAISTTTNKSRTQRDAAPQGGIGEVALEPTLQSASDFCAWPVRRKTLPLGQSRKTSQFEQSGLRA
jgi:low affinity Fe/Cu permease